jgi:hypothetical protein
MVPSEASDAPKAVYVIFRVFQSNLETEAYDLCRTGET